MTTSRITCEIVRSERATGRVAHRRDERALVHRAAAGDERAWTLLVGRFDATIRSLARRFGLAPADRDEVAQRTWLAFHRHVGNLADHPALGGWLLTTARRECLRVIEASRRERPVEDPLAGREPESTPLDDEILAAERRAALHRALDRVPEHERRLMHVLLRESAPNYAEVSATLGIPHGSIGPTRGRCIQRLRGDRHLAQVIQGTCRPFAGHDLG